MMIKSEQLIDFYGQATKVTCYKDVEGIIPAKLGDPVGLIVAFDPPLVFDTGPEDELEQGKIFNDLIESLKQA